MFSSALVYVFVSKHDYTEIIQPIFTKFSGKVAHGPWKKPLDFGDNPAQVMESTVMVRVIGGSPAIARDTGYVYPAFV